MKKIEILQDILDNGGFDNVNEWTKKQIAEWVRSNYNCSAYIAKEVAFYLVKGYYIAENKAYLF